MLNVIELQIEFTAVGRLDLIPHGCKFLNSVNVHNPTIQPHSLGQKFVWLSWEVHRRNRSISSLLGADLYEIGNNKSRLPRYILCTIKTIFLLCETTTRTKVFAQNPSVLLSLVSVVYGQLCNRTVVIDAHNIGVIFEHQIRMIRWIGQKTNNLIIKLATIIIVTNEELSSVIRQRGGLPFVLPDPLPVLQPKEKKTLSGQVNAIVICTFANDEPYGAIFDAAKKLPRTTVIYFTGNHKKMGAPPDLSDNIIFTGYLDEQDYIDYLDSSDIVLDLTSRDSCLVCGAYEGMALGKPLILSDTQALRGYFGEGATYTKNYPDAIAEAIHKVSANLKKATESVLKRRAEITQGYPEKLRNLEILLSQYHSTSLQVQEH